MRGEKTVDEIFSAGGEKWHTGCFKCSMCNKMLDSTNNNAKDNVLYCKVRKKLLEDK